MDGRYVGRVVGGVDGGSGAGEESLRRLRIIKKLFEEGLCGGDEGHVKMMAEKRKSGRQVLSCTRYMRIPNYFLSSPLYRIKHRIRRDDSRFDSWQVTKQPSAVLWTQWVLKNRPV